MKLGFVSAILDGWSFEEMIDTARDLGFSCVEAACWPSGKAERRYAGVSHIDVDGLTDEKAAYILGYCKERGVELSSLAFYPNTMDEDLEKRAANIAHLKKVILASEKLGVGMVTTFVGRATHKTVEENLELFREIWPPIVAFAEEHHVKVAIENCPMWFDATNWPGGQNLFTTPDIWRRCFEILPSPNFGINYDPSHFIWQQMDYIRPLYEFKDRIFHVHYKDIKLYPEKLARVGVMAYPLQYMEPKLPGLGDVNWAKYVSALTDIGYSGYTCIEVEDRAFEGSRERILDSLRLSAFGGPPSERKDIMGRIIAVNSNCYHGYSIEQAIDGIAAAGFRYIELTATKGWTEHVFPDQSFERLWQVKERLAEKGLTPFSMSGHCNLMDTARIHDFISNIRLAAFFGCGYIVSSIGEAHLSDQAVASNEVVAEHIRALVPELEKYGLTLVLETHGDHGSGKILKEIVDRVGSPRVGINYDTANALFYGNVDLGADLDASMDAIRYMHLKDKGGERTVWDFPALGKGWLDFPLVFDKLAKAGNDCPFSIEIEFTQAGAKDLAEINQAVKDSAGYLTAHGFVL